jgi:division protein CdvB (Snf7/Vps24/ESCRT-III family)
MAVELVDVATAAGPGVGAGIGAWAGLRFVRWLVEFIAKRLDVRSARMDAREKQLEAKFNSRLHHVEQELDKYRRATMLLVNRMAAKNPTDRVLLEVAEILGTEDRNLSGPLSDPITSPDETLDSLIRQVDEAVPDYVHPRKRGRQ